jgi:cell division protein FtsZ
MISAQAHEDANIIWGAAFDENMDDEMSVTVIATGFPTTGNEEPFPKKKEEKEKESAGTAAEKKTKESSGTEDDDFTDIMQIFSRKS